MIDYTVSDELAFKMMLFRISLENYVIAAIGKIIEKLEAENG